MKNRMRDILINIKLRQVMKTRGNKRRRYQMFLVALGIGIEVQYLGILEPVSEF